MLLIISKYNPLAGSSYIKIPKCLLKYSHLADHHPTRITKADKKFPKELDFKEIKIPFKTGDIHIIKKKMASLISYKDKVKYPIYVSKKCFEDKHVTYY